MAEKFSVGTTSVWKSDRTPVTEADTQINELVLNALRRHYPHIHVISEEGNGEVDGAEYRILCDPLDGTFAFMYGLPISSFCISVLRENTVLSSVIYDPFCKRMWSADRGKGAFLNGAPTRVNVIDGITKPNPVNVCIVWWQGCYYNMHAVAGEVMAANMHVMQPMTIALCGGLIASGTLEATVFPGQRGWETAAMGLIVEESGGKVTDIHGNPVQYGPTAEIEGHIISNGTLVHNSLVDIVRRCQ
ncbi:MAG: hypothetical protein AMXMBFR44_4540 [Candidatus Campbellbacteria bacterium]